MNDTDLTILNATFALAAEKGWADTHLHEIAHRAELTLADVYERAPSKQALLVLFSRQINETVLRTATYKGDENETARERLFEVLMSRFDAMKPFRPGLKAIARDLQRDPGAAALAAAMVPPAMMWMLEAAVIDVNGFTGPGKVLALSGLYLQALRVWMDDDSEDQARTMAELDRLLKKAEGWARGFGMRR